jgi:hypothetical protein
MIDIEDALKAAMLLVSGSLLGLAYLAGFASCLLIVAAREALAWAWKRRMKKDKI